MPPFRPSFASLIVALPLIGCGPTAAPPAAPSRPPITITATEAYDAGTVPPDSGSYPEIYRYIDANLPKHLGNIQRWLRQPSVSAQNLGIQQMAEMVRDDYKKLGCQTSELVPTQGHPGVFASCDYGAPKTLLVYMMYDVQPVEPKDWRSPPFAAGLVDHDLGKVLMGRGATNQKGPERSFLNALESIIAVQGKLPVNLVFAAEGEEELGSPHFPEVIDKHQADYQKATGVLFPFLSQDPSGTVAMFMGVKGILYFELEAVGSDKGGPVKAEIHGSYKAIVDSPTWRLIQALSTLTSADGNVIAVPHYYDAIRQPNDEEQRLLNGLLADWTAREAGQQKALGVSRWIEGWTGKETQLQYLFNTTLNVDGIGAGYVGEGTKTILPHKALAKVDSRLVPNQHPDSQLALIRKHLDSLGFTDIAIRKLSGYPAAQSSVEAPLIKAAIGVYRKHGITPSVAPRLAGSAPYYVFTDRLKLPMVSAGIGYGTGAHAPNEIMLVEPKAGSKVAGLADQEKFFVDMLFALAKSK